MIASEITTLLQTLGENIPTPAQLILVGGSALALLGSPRPTLDLDFLGDDLAPTVVHQWIMEAARVLNVYAEPVPLERFIPLPEGSRERTLYMGQFGKLEVYVADPYSIALSKLDRGFDTDLDDIVFLLRRRLIVWTELEDMVHTSLSQARGFDLDPVQMLAHLNVVQQRV